MEAENLRFPHGKGDKGAFLRRVQKGKRPARPSLGRGAKTVGEKCPTKKDVAAGETVLLNSRKKERKDDQRKKTLRSLKRGRPRVRPKGRPSAEQGKGPEKGFVQKKDLSTQKREVALPSPPEKSTSAAGNAAGRGGT